MVRGTLLGTMGTARGMKTVVRGSSMSSIVRERQWMSESSLAMASRVRGAQSFACACISNTASI